MFTCSGSFCACVSSNLSFERLFTRRCEGLAAVIMPFLCVCVCKCAFRSEFGSVWCIQSWSSSVFWSMNKDQVVCACSLVINMRRQGTKMDDSWMDICFMND